MITDSFNQDQISHINRVKQLIEEHVDIMLSQSWCSRPWHPVPRLSIHDAYLSGGAIASLLQNETPKDWDYYFNDFSSMHNISQFLTNTNNADLIQDVDPAYSEVFGTNGKMITSQAITTVTGDSFITLLYGHPDQVRKSFDYVHCMPYYDISSKKLYISPKQYRACTHKKLIVNNPQSIKTWRTEKFKQRGYTDA